MLWPKWTTWWKTNKQKKRQKKKDRTAALPSCGLAVWYSGCTRQPAEGLWSFLALSGRRGGHTAPGPCLWSEIEIRYMMFSGELCRFFGVTVSRREALLESEEKKPGRFQTLSNMEPLTWRGFCYFCAFKQSFFLIIWLLSTIWCWKKKIVTDRGSSCCTRRFHPLSDITNKLLFLYAGCMKFFFLYSWGSRWQIGKIFIFSFSTELTIKENNRGYK